ncbi:sialidase family protein [Tahibacter caeni]|uniref:sialidase family protein n=1 Tax=Tahibacter caeni TaxID=1453545 RepID=UPI002147861B|nr:sialidase family protein [Tahibacter caeni]
MKTFALFSFTALAGSAGTAALHAEPWQPLGPEGGHVAALLATPSNGNTRVLALTSGGLFKSDDAGRSWQESGHGLEFDVTSYAVIARYAIWLQRHYLFDGVGRLMRSEDNGDNWTATGFRLPPNQSAEALAVTPNGVVYSTYLGTFRSSDGGVTFAPVQGLPTDRPVTAFSFDSNSLQLLAGVRYRAPGEPAIYTSSDGGATWTPLFAPNSFDGVTDLHQLGAGRLAASLDGRIYISDDAGANWSLRFDLQGARIVQTRSGGGDLVTMNGRQCYRSSDQFVTSTPCSDGLPFWPYGGYDFNALVSVADGAGYRVLATARERGVIALQDSASVWTTSSAGLRAESRRGLVLWPNQPGRLLAGRPRQDSYTSAMAASSDGGATWQQNFVEQAAWIRTIALDPTTVGGATATLYAAGATASVVGQSHRNSGIFKSTDGGTRWTPLDDGIPPYTTPPYNGVRLSSVRKMLLDPRSCTAPPAQGACASGPLNTVFALTGGSGTDQSFRVIRSTQAGAAWMPVGADLPTYLYDGNLTQSVLPVDIEIDRTGTLYLSLFGDYYTDDGTPFTPTIVSGVFRSDDGGLTWTPRNAGLPHYGASETTTRDVFALAAHPRRAGVLWASTVEPGQSSRIHFSDDDGANWKNIGTALDGCDVRDLQVDTAAPQVVYAAGISVGGGKGCVWRSEDGGLNWDSIGAGLPVHGAYDLRQDPNDRRRLVVTTTSGVWQALLPSDRIFDDREN